ncbi:amidohydrolase family protein [Actinomycetospora termitidis]|uniref:Amidohydrolase family protein n=1 Tax=Actinomycetospora termitidis TaxID=3053470 RepID=A0ABT7MEI1_9PSEU|nr:amidohydrolase family protein [Actinomycetospora sp. Odt1-22]MDL5159067.1 amidohydrolase family protein [Actinomycetospora sp. Odt1-22]
MQFHLVGGTGLPIVDAHHHLFDDADDRLAELWGRRSLLATDYADLLGGHPDVVATVVVEGHTRYRTSGPEHLRPVGETEFLAGQADGRIAAAIVGAADLRRGTAVREVLEAHLTAAPGRFRGIRQAALWDEDPAVLGGLFRFPPHLYADSAFRAGFAELEPLGLSFDAFVLAPQLDDVVDLARAFPGTRIVLDHLGNPVGIGRHAGRTAAEFPAWRASMAELARCPSVAVKMSGLGTFLSGSPSYRADPPVRAEVLASEWRPWVEETIELFGADRVLFGSNLPTDAVGSFTTICTAYQRITAGCSDPERRALFSGTAAAVYGLDLDLVEPAEPACGPHPGRAKGSWRSCS